MTNDHPTTDLLQEHAEESLSPAERGRVDDHLAFCESCRAERERLRSLMDALRALPEAVDPGVDLRPGIRSEIRRRSARRGRRTALRQMGWSLSAAAAVLIIVTATVTALLVRTPDPMPRPDLSASFALLEQEYVRAADELTRALENERERDRLSAETLELVEANLRSVELALAESRAALSEDPVSPALRELVLAAHRHRLDVLRRATITMAGT